MLQKEFICENILSYNNYTPKYTCDRCLKEFSQKSHFVKHQNKKNTLSR